VFPTLNATRRNVGRDWPGLAEIKRRGQGARESSPLSSGPPDFRPCEGRGTGPRVFLLLLLSPCIVPNPSIERLRPVSFALFLPHLLPLPLLDRGPARLLLPGECYETHPRIPVAKARNSTDEERAPSECRGRAGNTRGDRFAEMKCTECMSRSAQCFLLLLIIR